jgi:hypothetical protein
MRELPSPIRDGCWLEAAAIARDSLRLQIRCTMPAPGHHIGVLDARLPFRDGAVVYRTNEAAGHCRITVRFAAASAIVTQNGSDQACGFGAFVNVSGRDARISRRAPPFDLAPVERTAGRRPRS